eukprot:Plantae.Rhodophyta-Purpureofilum_apyrenoidigerum.ctg27687.p1 GENE.Plantae.Rhodophyta-Purpureofilum_apyrenoidigerum.ctg27687~~Plantae.Rhodophyta-Purpureofilum_apyrenoidigerum.ctg27687.p1  ORF type:complete len:349 (-),score=49.46 Plantae.Rhodophyta-Purpureofilum_apyrenoidigerum.ctg27687:105-1151(-)
MEPYGEIVDLTVLRCKASHRGKGCGFCTYATRESALAAIENLHDKRVYMEMKNPLQVKFADAEPVSRDRRTKLFVGQLPHNVNERALSDAFVDFGNIVECQILRRVERSRGCGFVKFEHSPDADKAVAAMHGTIVFQGQTSPLNVSYAETSKDKQQRQKMRKRERGYGSPTVHHMPLMNAYQPSPTYLQEFQVPYAHLLPFPNIQIYQYGGGMRHQPSLLGPQDNSRPRRGPSGCNLFIYNVPHEWNDHILAERFAPFGKVLSSKVYIDMETRQSKGFGFISYENPQAAELAISQMNEQVLSNGKVLKVSLKNDPAKPSSQVSLERTLDEEFSENHEQEPSGSMDPEL